MDLHDCVAFDSLCSVKNAVLGNFMQVSGADPGFNKGSAKLTQWWRMRRLLSRTSMYGSTLLHKFFVKPPIFPSEEQKINK